MFNILGIKSCLQGVNIREKVYKWIWRGAYKRQFTVSSTCFFSGTRLAVYLPVHHNSHPKVPSGWWVCELHWTVGTGDPTNNRHQVSLQFFALEKKNIRGDVMFVNERWLFTRDPNYSALNGNKKLFFLHIWSLMRGLVLPTRDSNQ